MSKMLARNIFIDASTFRRECFSLSGHKLGTIYDLGCKGKISIFLTDITLQETRNLLDEFIEDIKLLHLKLSRKLEPFKEILKQSLVDKNDNEEEIAQTLDKIRVSLEDYFEDVDATILPVSQVDSAKIFESYFSQRPPFGDGKKKFEFPDAFSLLALQDWCEENDQKMYVVSADSDMEAYCNSSESLFYLPNLSHFLDLVNSEENLVSEEMRIWLHENQDFLTQKIWLSLQERIKGIDLGIDSQSKIKLSFQDIKLGGQIYSASVEQFLAYAYTEAKVTFTAKGSCPSTFETDFTSLQTLLTDGCSEFELRWLVNCEVEVEFRREPEINGLIFSGAWVVGSINLDLESASNIIFVR